MATVSVSPLVDSKDEEHLRLLVTFHYVVAGLGALFACMPLIHVGMGVMMLTNPNHFFGQDQNAAPPPAFGYLFIATGAFFFILGWSAAVCTFVSGRYLAKRKKRMFSFVMACLMCMFFPFGTVLGVFTIIVLSRESVQRLYAKAAYNSRHRNSNQPPPSTHGPD